MQWYVTSVSRGSLYEKFGNKCVKILKFWRTELSYAQNKNRGKKVRLLGMDTCPSLNGIHGRGAMEANEANASLLKRQV
jgi:endonuclease YncB( thermonuclease family)